MIFKVALMESNYGVKCIKKVLILFGIVSCVIIIIAVVSIPVSKYFVRQQIASVSFTSAG